MQPEILDTRRGVVNNDDKEVSNKIQLRFIDRCRFMVRSQDKLASNLYDTSEIKCDKCDDDMELVNISNIALPECERCITKKSKGFDKRVLKRALTTLAGIGFVMKRFA